MHDNVPSDDFELIQPDIVENTPIGLCTLGEIVMHLSERFDGIAVATVKSGREPDVFIWGNKSLRETMLNILSLAHGLTVDTTEAD
jgi:hypothetical protein